MPRWPRVALTACARSSLESIRVPSRSKISRSIAVTGSLTEELRRDRFLAWTRFGANGFAFRLARAQVILGHFTLQRVAMNPQPLAGFRTVPSRALQGFFDQRSLQQLHHFFEEKTVAD